MLSFLIAGEIYFFVPVKMLNVPSFVLEESHHKVHTKKN